MPKGQTVLVVDPDADFLKWAVRQLTASELHVTTATRADEALKLFTSEAPDLVIADTHLEPYTGQELLTRLRERDGNAFVLLVSQYGTTQAVIEAMESGRFRGEYSDPDLLAQIFWAMVHGIACIRLTTTEEKHKWVDLRSADMTSEIACNGLFNGLLKD